MNSGWYWRIELQRRARAFRKRATMARKPSAQSYALLEVDFVFGMFAIRKLLKSHKLPSKLRGHSVHLDFCPVLPEKRGRITLINAGGLDLYADPVKRHLSVGRLCDEVVHSVTLDTLGAEGRGGIWGFQFVSDRHRQEGLYMMEATAIADLFEKVGKARPTAMTMTRIGDGPDVDVEVT